MIHSQFVDYFLSIAVLTCACDTSLLIIIRYLDIQQSQKQLLMHPGPQNMACSNNITPELSFPAFAKCGSYECKVKLESQHDQPNKEGKKNLFIIILYMTATQRRKMEKKKKKEPDRQLKNEKKIEIKRPPSRVPFLVRWVHHHHQRRSESVCG